MSVRRAMGVETEYGVSAPGGLVANPMVLQQKEFRDPVHVFGTTQRVVRWFQSRSFTQNI